MASETKQTVALESEMASVQGPVATERGLMLWIGFQPLFTISCGGRSDFFHVRLYGIC